MDNTLDKYKTLFNGREDKRYLITSTNMDIGLNCIDLYYKEVHYFICNDYTRRTPYNYVNKLHKDEFGYAYFQRKTLRYSTEKCGYYINIIKADWEEVVYQLLIRTENYVGVDSLLTSDGEYVIKATRSRYPYKEIVAVFQPDRFSRGLRFAKEFAQAMDLADHPFLMHFPDNAKKEPGIDIDIHEIGQYIPRAKIIRNDQNAVELLSQYDNVVFLFMSSKDIYKLEEALISYKESH